MEVIFSKKGASYLKNNMNICLEDFTEKLLLDAKNHLNYFKEFVDYMIGLTPPYPYSKIECADPEYIQNDLFLNKKFCEFIDKNSISEGTSEYFISDTLRHAFISFKEGGLYRLFKFREAEGWYPKVIIRQQINSRDSISNLETEVVVYRGTSKEEYDSGLFGQSWTLSELVANDFAFKHYSVHDKYVNTSRVVIKTKIHKDSIYYYNSDDDEQETIIDERKIIIAPPEIIVESVL